MSAGFISASKVRCAVYIVLTLCLTLHPQNLFADFSLSSSKEGRRIVERLSEDRRLLLSLDGIEKQFSFLISIGRSLNEKVSYQVHYYVVRDEESVAVVMLSQDGSPYGYSRIGLCALLGSEPERPLLLTEGGAPKVVLKLKDMGKNLVFELAFSSRLKDPEIVIDIPSILAEAVKNASRIDYDKAGSKVTIDTEHHARITLTLSDQDDETSSFKEMIIESSSGMRTVISNISFSDKDSEVTKVSRQRFETLSVPKQKVPKGSVLLVPPFPPEKFGELSNDAFIISELRRFSLPGLPSEKALPKEEQSTKRAQPQKVQQQNERGFATT